MKIEQKWDIESVNELISNVIAIIRLGFTKIQPYSV